MFPSTPRRQARSAPAPGSPEPDPCRIGRGVRKQSSATSSADPLTGSSAPQSLRESKKERTRRALAEAAMHLVIAHGYAGATVEAIAARAGVSVRTFHNYFPSKDTVFTHPFEEMCTQLLASLRQEPEGIPLFDALSHAWIDSFERQRERIVQIAIVVGAISEVPSLRDAVTGGAISASAPVLAELARRDGDRPDSQLTAALALRMVIEATGLAFAAHPLTFTASPVDQESLRKNEHLLDDVRNALGKLRSIFNPPQVSAAPRPTD